MLRRSSPADPDPEAAPHSGGGASRSRPCRTPRPRPAPAAAGATAAPAGAGGDWGAWVPARGRVPRAVPGAARGPRNAWQLCPETGPGPRIEFRPSQVPPHGITGRMNNKSDCTVQPSASSEANGNSRSEDPPLHLPGAFGVGSPESCATQKGVRSG